MDIYDNLENYNDVNIVDELKCENKELKMKLEEYSKAMAKMQKDLDNLNKEHKKLEKNYSSLLKTARAEIERKTETIKTLNTEKDMIIIKALQTTGKNISNITKTRSYSNDRSQNRKCDDLKKNKEASVESNQGKDNRVNSNCTSSVETSNIGTDNKSLLSEGRISKNVDINERNKNKENVSKNLCKDESANTRRAKIINRRKSVPIMSLSEKFSSDEETERTNTNMRRSPPRLELKQYERQDYRTSDHGYETYNNPYRNRSNIYMGSERRSDNYTQQQWRRSPERYQQRFSRDYTDNYNLKADHRQRVLRSPPSDKYNRSKSRDRRFTTNPPYSEYDKYSNQYIDNYAVKHKIRNEFDEPCNKKQKMDMYSNDWVEKNNYVYSRDRDISGVKHILPPQEYIELSSCQSPDYVDPVGHWNIKEIKVTAATKLDDPRTKSKKYIHTTSNNTPSLVSALGKDVDLKAIDLSAWGIEHYKMPEALLKPFWEQETSSISQVYNMDTDNNNLNKLEEIQINPDSITPTSTSMIDTEIASQIKNGNNNKNSKIDKEFDGKGVNTNQSEKSTKFKIPKIKNSEKIENHKELDKREPCEFQKIESQTKDIRKTSSSKDNHVSSKSSSKVKKANLPIIKKVESSEIHPNNVSFENEKQHTNKNNMNGNFEVEQTNNERKRQEILKTIEGDLELSDETSDKECHKDVDKNKLVKQKHNLTKDSTNHGSSEHKTSSSDKNTKTKEKGVTKESTSKNNSKDCKDTIKRRRSKRKMSEHKDTKHESEENDVKTVEKVENVVKKVENNDKTDEQNISKQTRTKFNDLFGDNSLITLDDLGLDNEVQPATKYLPIFENTQDAVDLNIVDTNKVVQSNMLEVKNIESTSALSLNEKQINNKMNFSINVTVVNENCENNSDNKEPLNSYGNTKAENVANSPSVVKTVIISSGIQPECLPEICTPNITNKPLEPLNVTVTDTIVKKCALNSNKELPSLAPQKIDAVTVQNDNAYTPNINKTSDVSLSSNISNSSNANKTDAENEDVPDVRIFVKRRRRKVIKKTT